MKLQPYFKLFAGLCVLGALLVKPGAGVSASPPLLVKPGSSASASLPPCHMRQAIQHFYPLQGLQQERPHTLPTVCGSGNLKYHGGIVQHHPISYLIFWGPSWDNNGQLTGDAQVVVSYFTDIGGNAFENILTQYYDTQGHIKDKQTFGGDFLDIGTPPTDNSCGGPTVENASIQNEVNYAISVKGWKKSTDATFFVYTPNGDYVNDPRQLRCSNGSYCAYHRWSSADGFAYGAMVYPYDNSGCQVPYWPNSNKYGDSLASISSHEQFESITDVKGDAWFDDAGYEIGDKCLGVWPKGPQGNSYTYLDNGGVFELQEEYSNASSSCVNSYPWGALDGSNPGSVSNSFDALATISANDIWAVGTYADSGGSTQTLIEQWNGTSWTHESSPSPGTDFNFLYGVAAVSANDIWAVGVYSSGEYDQPLVEQYLNGQWNVIPTPSPGGCGSYLYGVAAISIKDVWAVGYQNSGCGTIQTLVEQWNGTEWNVVPSPNPDSDSQLFAVAAVSANDIWAVGDSSGGTLVEQWNGSQWNVVSSPNVSSNYNVLLGVATVSATDAWSVGRYYNINKGTFGTLIEQWNGSQWNVVSSPNVSSSDLYSVAAVSASDVWAVGDWSSQGYYATLIEQWNGKQWNVAPSPNVSTVSNSLGGVAAVSASDVWAVGTYNYNGAFDTLAEHYPNS